MKKYKLIVGGLALLAALISVKKVARASYEQAPYEVLETAGEIEIRQYKPFLTATVETPGGFKESMNRGFRRLAGFIFGKNDEEKKIAMTTPVLFDAPERNKSSKMSFMVPSQYQLSDLPKPEDEGIVFEQQPAKVMAALRFSGNITEELWMSKKEELMQKLSATEYEAVSDVLFYGYDPPVVPAPLKRNEVVVEVRRK